LLGKQPAQQDLFDTVDLAQLVPDDHLLRKIDKHVGLDFIYKLTEPLYCSDNGRPSIDPVLFFRMQLVSYLYGMKSDRHLCREVHLNIAYRWFCRLKLSDPVPYHSSMTRVRDRFGETLFEQIFSELQEKWRQEGVIPGKRLIVDASLVDADASLDSMVPREEADPDARALKAYEQRCHDFKEGKKQRKVSNQTHVSRTDPDATLVSRTSSYRKLSYKAHVSIDAKHRFIVDCHATTGSRHECPVLPERMAHLHNVKDLQYGEVIAGRGYGRGPTYTELRNRQIRHYIPLHEARGGGSKLTTDEFKYDRRNDRFRCPQDQYLYPYEKSERDSVFRYRVTGGHCRRCPIQDSCLPPNQKHRARFAYRAIHQDEIEATRRARDQTHSGKSSTSANGRSKGCLVKRR